jgi:hypothetical protein
LGGAAVVRNEPFDLIASPNAAALSRLPAGHRVTRFLSGPQNHRGIWFTGHQMPDAVTFAKRIAFRYYIYHSPDYSFGNPTDGFYGCNAKLHQFSAGLLTDFTFGYLHNYNFTTWNPPQNCCLSGPGPDNANTSIPDWLNRWWRIEVVMVNRNAANTGQHWRQQIYLKNVTDGLPEKLVIDTDAAGTELNPVNPRIPPEVMTKLLINLYRGENTANQCFGFKGISHYMVAGWDTDAGQRIGASSEIEGAGASADKVPPGAPKNLR